LPNNLIVVLKRFTHDGRKIHTPLIPFTQLCLSELFSSNSPNKKHSTYSIRSIIDHFGSSHGGHYTAQAKRGDGDESKWYMYDDQDIREMDGPNMGDSSYILFLEKV
jgi:ubiquitin C-terminal hydrolase